MLKFKVLEYYRDSKNASIALSPTDYIGYDHTTVTGAMEEKEMSGAIFTTIQAMPTQQRLVFLLSRQVNMTNKEIATELGISVKAVEAHMTKALKFLREKLDYKWLLAVILLSEGVK